MEVTAGSDPAGARHEGKAAVGRALDDLFRAVPNIHFSLLDHYVGDGHLVIEVLVTGNNVETKSALRYQICDILIFRGEEIQTKRSYRKVGS